MVLERRRPPSSRWLTSAWSTSTFAPAACMRAMASWAVSLGSSPAHEGQVAGASLDQPLGHEQAQAAQAAGDQVAWRRRARGAGGVGASASASGRTRTTLPMWRAWAM